MPNNAPEVGLDNLKFSVDDLKQFRDACRDSNNRLGSSLAICIEELVDRRAAEASELRQLERSLAYSSAASWIDSFCANVGDSGDWFDLGNVDPMAGGEVEDAVRYLELRGLIERDPAHPNHISIRDESEATA